MPDLRRGETAIMFIARTAKKLRQKNKRMTQRQAISKASAIYRRDYKTVAGKQIKRKGRKRRKNPR